MSMITTKEYIELDRKNPWYSKDYTSEEEREADKNAMREYNKAMIESYPFLEPFNAWSGKRITKCAAGEKGYWPKEPDKLPEYDYEYTLLDNMPDGWRVSLGDNLCKEIKQALLNAQEKDPNGGYEESWITTNYDSKRILPYLEGFRIEQIKEKFGSLRIYCGGAPKEIYDVISKYEKLSERICIRCGEPAEWETIGWYSPWCGKCKSEIESELHDKFIPIDEFYNDN